MLYTCTAISFLLRSVLLMSVIGLTLLLLARFSGCLLSNLSCCSLLKAAHPERFPPKVPFSPDLSSSSSASRWGQKFQEWSVLLHPLLLLHVQFFFVLERADSSTMPSHFLQPAEILTAVFTNLNSRVWLWASYNAFTLP
jgi:hypothetical protein